MMHSPHAFQTQDDELFINGKPLSQLAIRAGQTPFYAYDRSQITQRVQYLRHSLPAEIQLHYAIKANPMPALVHHLAGLVDGFDVASAGELRTALDTTIPSQQISFAGPGKTEAELRQAIASEVIINVESTQELQRIQQLGRQIGIRPHIALRVNPDFELKSSGMKMSGGPKPFGIDAEQTPALLAQLPLLDIEFHGFHIFCGSQNLRADAIMDAQQKTIQLAMQLAQQSPLPIRSLNIGGGFGIPYFPGETALALEPIGEHLASLLTQAKTQLTTTEFVLELGRYLVGEAGIYVCQVLDKKYSRGQLYLITDGGLHHHLAASGNFGQVIRKNYLAHVGNRLTPPDPAIPATVVGPLCTPLDILAQNMPLGHAEIGDFIVIFQSGAYGPSASPSAFLGHPSALELLV